MSDPSAYPQSFSPSVLCYRVASASSFPGLNSAYKPALTTTLPSMISGWQARKGLATRNLFTTLTSVNDPPPDIPGFGLTSLFIDSAFSDPSIIRSVEGIRFTFGSSIIGVGGEVIDYPQGILGSFGDSTFGARDISWLSFSPSVTGQYAPSGYLSDFSPALPTTPIRDGYLSLFSGNWTGYPYLTFDGISSSFGDSILTNKIPSDGICSNFGNSDFTTFLQQILASDLGVSLLLYKPGILSEPQSSLPIFLTKEGLFSSGLNSVFASRNPSDGYSSVFGESVLSQQDSRPGYLSTFGTSLLLSRNPGDGIIGDFDISWLGQRAPSNGISSLFLDSILADLYPVNGITFNFFSAILSENGYYEGITFDFQGALLANRYYDALLSDGQSSVLTSLLLLGYPSIFGDSIIGDVSYSVSGYHLKRPIYPIYRPKSGQFHPQWEQYEYYSNY